MQIRKQLVWAALMVSPVVMAQDGDGPWKGEGEAGVLFTEGNSRSTNINTRLALKYEIVDWRNTMEFRSSYAESENSDTGESEATAEKYNAQAESNYKFDRRQFWFLRGSYEADRFAGYDFQSSATTGYGNRVWEQGEKSFLELKTGVGYRYNRLNEPDEDGDNAEKGTILRFAGAFNFALSENALFIQELSSEVGVKDGNAISESLTAVQANVVGNLSMKLGYRVKHNTDVPPASEKTDSELSLTLLYGF